jgi:SAM-dependent methyltransferase
VTGNARDILDASEMSDWTDGYVTDVGYVYGYFAELNPLLMRMAFLDKSLLFPRVGTACELGFGQGMSTNIHAAASGVQWYGTDFNPAQAGFAQEVARACGSSARLFDQSFAEFCQRSDLPDFDYIGLHGIWSWVSDENRSLIVDFMRRKLKVGGVVYISYNVQPGWTGMAPIRHLMNQHVQVMSAAGQGVVAQVDAAVKFVERLFATDCLYAKTNPMAVANLQKISKLDRHYLAHEYFNRDWQPMPFSVIADRMSEAKLTFACSANYLDHIDSLNMTPEQRTFLLEQADPVFRETVRDILTNQQFRRDYWVKGSRQLNPLERAELLRSTTVALCRKPDSVSMTVKVGMGEATLAEAIYQPILDALATKPSMTLGEIEQLVAPKGISASQIAQAVMVMVGAGNMVLCQEAAVIPQVTPHTRKLNNYLYERALTGADVNYLTSPLTGGAVSVGRFAQLFLLARQKGMLKPAEWAKFACDVLDAQGARLVKDGVAMASAEDHLAEMTTRATSFAQSQLPVLKNLGIAY